MENQAFIDSLMKEIIHPGVDQLMNSRYFPNYVPASCRRSGSKDSPCSTTCPIT